MAHELTYAFIATSDKDKVDFSEVVQDPNTVRYSLDGTLFIIKWDKDETPSFITDGSVVPTWSGNHAGVLIQLQGSNWTPVAP